MQRWHWFDTDFMNLTVLNDNDVTPAETQTLGYDDVGRLASASSTAYGTRAYTYDKVGNRLTEVRTLPATAAVTHTYTYPTTSNRLTDVKQGATALRAFTYDAAGNVTQDNRAGTAWNTTINKAGRLTIIKQGTTTKGTYTYDGRQRLAVRVVANTTGYNGTSHILHGYVGCPEPMNENALEGGAPCDRILAETDGTGPAGTKREYIWLGDMPVAVIDKSVTPNKTYMVHADHLNRPYFMTDSTKAEVWKAIYEPFGTVYSTTGTAAQTHRFPGQWFQIESGLAYNWHRHYDATLGRYVSVDPLGVAAGANVYGYVGQRPTLNVDPAGLLVELCQRSADLPFPANQFNHMWIKTDRYESGMGGECPVPGQQCSDKPYSSTATKDHSGQSSQLGASCTPVKNVDEACVNARIAPGQSTGSWSPVNQCQSFAFRTLNACRTRFPGYSRP